MIVDSEHNPDDDPLQGAVEELEEAIEKGADLAVEGVEVPHDYPLLVDRAFLEYVDAAKRLIGDDVWATDKAWWLEQMNRDWETMQVRAEIEAEQARLRQLGGVVATEAISGGFDRINALRFIDYDQFILEANAGHFREDRFYCDKGRRWMNKVKAVFVTYGYPYVRKVEVDGLTLLEVSKNPMGDIQ